MSDQGDSGPMFTGGADHRTPPTPRRRRKKSSIGGYVAMLVALAVVAGAAYVFIPRLVDNVKDRFGGPADYAAGAADGEASFPFEIHEGDSVSTVGAQLVDVGVVASAEAFRDAADASGRTLQIGIFPLTRNMTAADAVAVLVDPSNRLSSLTLLPGKTVDEIIGLLAQDTDFGRPAYKKALRDPAALGLPKDADGDAEGYLFPGQYLIAPDATAASILKMMVDRFKETAEKVDLAGAAKKLGYTEHQLVTIASMVQAEVPAPEMPKVARVIYNRLEIEPNPAAGFLQIDATVNYALGRGPITKLTIAEIDSVADSPYNTYRQKGLPPGPIETPGESALEAATHPADGPWFFYVTVNLQTQETKFTDSYDEFQQFKAELDDYCANESKSNCGR